MSAAEIVLDVQDLQTWFPARHGHGGWVRAVDGVSFAIRRGETFGLVGESGSGKTTLGRSILRLDRPRAGKIIFEGEDLLAASPRRLKRLRRDMQAILQDSHGALDPRMTVRQLIGEGLRIQGARDREAQVTRIADTVGLRAALLSRYPHELSGGQRQRVGIARALVLQPKLVVADEPVSALDLSVQSQVLNLLAELQAEFHLTYLLITHDFSVVEHSCDRIGVMYLGRLMELAPAEALIDDARVPYTQALLSAIPGRERVTGRARIVLRGDVPSPLDPPSGCPFRTRCWRAADICAAEVPPLRAVAPDHLAACHFAT